VFFIPERKRNLEPLVNNGELTDADEAANAAVWRSTSGRNFFAAIEIYFVGTIILTENPKGRTPSIPNEGAGTRDHNPNMLKVMR